MNATLSNAAREQPHNLDAEAGLLGCLLADSDPAGGLIADAIVQGVTAAHFYDTRNGFLFSGIARLHAELGAVVVEDLVADLRRRDQLAKAGDVAHLAEITGAAPTSAQFKRHLGHVLNCHRLRSVILAAGRLIEDARAPEADAGEIAARLSAGLDGITANHSLAASTTSAATLCAKPPLRPAEIIEGILFQSGTMMLSGPSKARKTFTFLDLALSVATGFQWLGFSTAKAPVLYLNFELAEHSFQYRLATICEAKGLKPPANLFTLNLRGRTVTIQSLAAELPRLIKRHGIGLVVLDPWYKLSANSGAEENSNDGQARILSEAERIVTSNGAALVVGHHFAKGDASAKNAIDRAAGAGAMARWGDVIATLSEHEAPDCMTLEMFLRDFAPVEPVVLRWKVPIWQRDITLDPAKLKRVGRTDSHPPSELLDKLVDGMTNQEWLEAAGWPESTFRRKRDDLLKARKVTVKQGAYYRI
jgi:hypothetical protein